MLGPLCVLQYILKILVENNCMIAEMFFFFPLFISLRQTELDQRAFMYSAPCSKGNAVPLRELVSLCDFKMIMEDVRKDLMKNGLLFV